MPARPRIAEVEACRVSASRPLAHDLTVNDLQLPDRDVAVVVLKNKVLTRGTVTIGVKPCLCEVSHAYYMPSRSGVREVGLNVEVDLRAQLSRVLPDRNPIGDAVLEDDAGCREISVDIASRNDVPSRPRILIYNELSGKEGSALQNVLKIKALEFPDRQAA